MEHIFLVPNHGSIQYFISIVNILNNILLGFYDTSDEKVKALEPNYKKLRQEHMDDKRRDIQEEVVTGFCVNCIMRNNADAYYKSKNENRKK